MADIIRQIDLILGKIDVLMKKITSWKSISVISLIVTLLCFNACTTIHFKAIAPPQPSSKLRVAVLPVTGDKSQYGWAIPHDRWSNLMFKMVSDHLRDTGIYEVVPQEDVNYAVGREVITFDEYWWSKDDYALLKQYGKALYADYAMIITRDGSASPTYKYNIKFINIETGMCYLVSEYYSFGTNMDLNEKIITKTLWPRIYRKLFSEVKRDLLATATRKGRLIPEEERKKPEPHETKIALAPPPVAFENKPAPVEEERQKPIPPVSTAQEETKAPILPPLKAKVPAEESVPQSLPTAKLPDTIVKQPVPDTKKDTETPRVIAKVAPVPPPELKAADKRKEFEKKLDHELQTETPAIDKAKLVVYDFDTVERLNVVALILTDALREELFILGRFSLVNRENMMQVMQELKLQHSGLVAEKEIVELGKWLAANQAVTGRLAMLGNSYVLQAKRTDIKTMGTLGLGTLMCSSGQEEELLSGMPILARKLIGMKGNF